MTTRIEYLARPKPNFLRLPDRESPEWKVSAAALKACPSERLCFLAEPRQVAPGWQPDRPLSPTLGMGMRRIAEASPRICQLAVPKKIWAPSYEKTNFTLKNPSKAEPSSRILLLAVPKKEHQDFVPNRPLSWHVAKSVLVAVASERLLELAVPKSRKPLFDECNPYKVSPAALSATASPRILELSLPSPRWCRTKSAHM
ncbi:theg spermatid protein [Silurus meridionalis]|uniref:Testicular haploid expressed gene protein-like n=1 Tax=Silurus meridionalis TaxID=175797 RepID=A0A8T0AIT4_SILME|nr:theg spermatid protein [Silurus meridionalis]KAF7692508.1 hypothetical protein HF521_010118 [Silurus meridionalis]